MEVGIFQGFQNPDRKRPDREVYKKELALLEQAEPNGYDSIWLAEHHFTGYSMSANPLTLLSYLAARTQTIKLGTAVIVLPWHDPLQVASEIVALDHLSDGRLQLGIGRGAGKVEFDAFRQDMNESRQRFIESADMILTGIEQGYCEYDGTYIKQPRADLRPDPFKTFRGRTYAASVSPESMDIMAKLGVGILVVTQKPWHVIAEELNTYRDAFLKHNHTAPPSPVVAAWVLCDKNAERARDMAKQRIGAYWQTILNHYQLHTGHLKGVKGYEFYGSFADAMQEHGPEAMEDMFVNLHIWGTPEQCHEKIVMMREKTGADKFVGVFSYGEMSWETVQGSFDLFTKEVKPALQKLPTAEGWAKEAA